MVYIDRDGRVLERRPWNLSRLVSIFVGLWFMAVTYFSTLFAPFMSNNRNRSQSNGRRSGNGGTSGPGGGGGSDDGHDGRPNRRIGRINTSAEMNYPTGGCGCGQ